MKSIIVKIVAGLVCAAGIVMGIVSGFNFSTLQKETFLILAIICLCSMAYCFIVGEITHNNSQMDKLWSILPIVYALIIMFKSHFNIRIIIMTVLIAFWGVRLTINFGLKGAYTIKFWEGEEDYRWAILRKTKPFDNKFVWMIFDLGFISIYQNVLVLLITLPLLTVMEASTAFNGFDIIPTLLTLLAIIYELIADNQQMDFQDTKWKMIKEGKKLEELPAPYNLGFNTQGLWAYSRHPNYLGEQSTWIFLYGFTISAGCVKYGIFNYSIIGCLLLIFLFMGSSAMAEGISKSKYPRYQEYQNKVFKYLPIHKF